MAMLVSGSVITKIINCFILIIKKSSPESSSKHPPKQHANSQGLQLVTAQVRSNSSAELLEGAPAWGFMACQSAPAITYPPRNSWGPL